MPRNPDIDNCEYEGGLGPLAGIVGSIQANEVVKEILNIGNTLCGHILINLSKKPFVVKSGDRVAQMILCPVVKGELQEVKNLPKTVRGKGGFGSTGR